MIRRFGPPARPGPRYRRRHGAYAVIIGARGVLLTHQAAPRAEWQLPGGGIDPGESPLRALRREVMEETGWRVRPLRRLGAYRRFVYMPEYDLWAEKLCRIYLARAVRRMGPPKEAGHRAAWLPRAVALTWLDSDGDRAFLRAVQAAGA